MPRVFSRTWRRLTDGRLLMDGDYCTEDGCHNLATTEYFEGMIGDDIVAMGVCTVHALVCNVHVADERTGWFWVRFRRKTR